MICFSIFLVKDADDVETSTRAQFKKSKIHDPKLNIIFFDGNCPMCHSWVRRIIQMDREKRIRFAPLDGETAKEILSHIMPGYLAEDTLVYFRNGEVYVRSDAAIRIAQDLGYSIAGVGKYIPKKWRDGIYRMVAQRRYKYGERYESCPLPPVEWRDRFLVN